MEQPIKIFRDYCFRLENQVLSIVHEDIAEGNYTKTLAGYEGYVGIKVYKTFVELYESLDYQGKPDEGSEPIIFKLGQDYNVIEQITKIENGEITKNILS